MPNNSHQRLHQLPSSLLLVTLFGLAGPGVVSAQEPGAPTLAPTQEAEAAEKSDPGAPAEVAPPEPEAATEPASPPAEHWAGKLTVIGYRRIPFLGKVEFRTSNRLIATVTRKDGRIELDQQVCSIDFEKVFGAKLHIDPDAPPRMPHAQPKFTPLADGSYMADFWTSGWDQTDHDQDGDPGVSIDVRAPLCGGDVFMESHARSESRAVPWHGALAGKIRVEVTQKVLGTHGACLAFMAKDHTQWLHGFVAYEPLDGPRGCDDMGPFSWPDYEADPPTIPEPAFTTNEK
jgi:hypothetical protein